MTSRTLCCLQCKTCISNQDEIISKCFQGHQSRAYLLQSVWNVTLGRSKEREMMTGTFGISALNCKNCKFTLGWKYEKVTDQHQQFKVGKYVVETFALS